MAFSEVTERLYYTDWQNGFINVIDVRKSDTTPRPVVTGLNNPLPITAHPHNRCVFLIFVRVICKLLISLVSFYYFLSSLCCAVRVDLCYRSVFFVFVPFVTIFLKGHCIVYDMKCIEFKPNYVFCAKPNKNYKNKV